MHHYIYRTDSPSGKFYIGRHSTDDLDDGYLGSGKWIRSIKDKSTLTKTILEFFDDFESLKQAETKYIAEVINDPLNMNFNENPVGFSSENNPNKSPERRQILSERVRGEKNPMYGKSHTEETKARLREATIRLKTGVPLSDEAKKNISEARRRIKYSEEGRRKLRESRIRTAADGSRMVPSFKGGKQTDEAKQILREKALARERKPCSHCGTVCTPQTMARWHGDNCKSKSK